MKRKALNLLAVVMLAGLAFSACYATATWIRRGLAAKDELAWLQVEFGLSADEMSRMRKLHEGYLPACREMCALIAAKDQEIEQSMAATPTFSPELDQKLREAATLRADCQAQMLRHFYEVSRAMPQEQGRRYLEKMQRLTLDLHSGHSHVMPTLDAAPHGHH